MRVLQQSNEFKKMRIDPNKAMAASIGIVKAKMTINIVDSPILAEKR